MFWSQFLFICYFFFFYSISRSHKSLLKFLILNVKVILTVSMKNQFLYRQGKVFRLCCSLTHLHGKMWLWSRENIWCVSLCSCGWTQLSRQLSCLVWGELHTSPLFIVPQGDRGCKGPLPEHLEDSVTKLFAYSHLKEFYSMIFYVCRDRSTWS